VSQTTPTSTHDTYLVHDYITQFRNAIPNISSKPNVTNKKTRTDSLITSQDTL